MLRVWVGLFGVICLLLCILLSQIRVDEPVQLMIVTGGGDNVFLFNEVSGNFISVTEEWDSRYFTGSKSAGVKLDFIPVPDGSLIVGYDTTSTLRSNLFLRFYPTTSEVEPLFHDSRFSRSHGLSPDGRWLIMSDLEALYRQRVGFDTVELVIEGRSLAFHGWLSDGRTMIVENRDAESGLYLIDVYTGRVELVETIGRVISVVPSPDPDWFTILENTNGQHVTYGVNFITGERVRLLPVKQSTWYTIVGFDDESQSLLYLDRESGSTRKLRRLHPTGIAETLFSNVSRVKPLSEDMLLVATTRFDSSVEIWFLSTNTWQSQHIERVFNQYSKVGGCAAEGCFIFDWNNVIFVRLDGTYSDTLSHLPGRVQQFYGQSPYDDWYIVAGEERSGRSYIVKLSPDGKKVQTVFPEDFAFGRFHGWMPIARYNWHFLPLLGVGVVLLLAGWRGHLRKKDLL